MIEWLAGIGILMIEGLKTFFDSRYIPDGRQIECDVCIIGGGAAGITIARELVDQDLQVLILESGGLDYEDTVEDLGKLVVTGRPYDETGTRLRFFGGATNHWGGHCVPLRSSIFEKRDWIPDGEWPFGLAELEPWYVRAHDVLEIGPYDYDPKAVARRLNLQLLPFDASRVETVLSRYHPQRFGQRYRQEVDRAANISVFLFATVSSLNVSDARRVTDVTVKTLAGTTFSVRPKITVLSAGGIENARLLLLSNRQVPAGVGNQHDLVGRYFSDHIWYPSGFVLPVDQDPASVEIYESEIPFEGDYGVRCHLALPEMRERELRIPAYRAELAIDRTYGFHPSTISAQRIRQHLGAWAPDDVSLEDVLNVVSDPMVALQGLFGRSDGPLVYGFSNYVEQVPNSESRVGLSTEKDALGMNCPTLRWQLSNLNKEGIVKAQEVIAAEVGRSGVGRMRSSIPESEVTLLEGAHGGAHHMGTTRMHVDPKRGVVDADARVHGMANLFIAGSSVFPSYGYENPTLTIVALSLRLADHLKTLPWSSL